MKYKIKSMIMQILFPNKSLKFWKYRERLLNENNHNKLSQIYTQYKIHRILNDCNASIPIKKEIQSFATPHGLSGIFISSGAVIGSDCVVFHQVTIGSNTTIGSKKQGSPHIGNNVFIGAGAKVIGGLKIGNNVRIGANCIVTSDIPDNCTVVMEKPRVIQHDRMPDNSFISWQQYTQEETYK